MTTDSVEGGQQALPKPSAGKAFIIALSFANLTFVNVWSELLDRQSDFYRMFSLTWRQLLALTLDVLLLALVLWALICLAAKARSRIWVLGLKWAILPGLLIPLNSFRFTNEAVAVQAFAARQPEPVRLFLALIGAAAGILLLWKWPRISIPVSTTFLMILAPLTPLLVGNAAWMIMTGPPLARLPDRPPQEALPQKAGAPHVLWFIFDEWDQAISFPDRPANFTLPELDRFRAQSIHADRAYPPTGVTNLSISSLLAGKTFVDSDAGGATELFLTYDRRQPRERLSAEPTIFSDARSAGFNVGIVGFYLSYCRVFGSTTCDWFPADFTLPPEWTDPARVSLGRFMVRDAKRLVAKVPLSKRLGIARAMGEVPFVDPERSIATYRQLHPAVHRTIADPRLNLVFVHWNLPHPPAFFKAAQNDFSTDPSSTYLDNLKLLDRTVGEIRVTLEKAGIWDSSTILMSADHPLRPRLWRTSYPGQNFNLTDHPQTSRVPFMLKLAGQKDGFSYDRPMQTVVSRFLLLAIMKGEISRPQEVAAWLDHNPPRQ